MMENCSSHYRVVKNVEDLSSVYSTDKAMQVWMQTVNLAFTENSVYTTRQMPSNNGVGTFLSVPLPSYYLLSCLLLLSIGHVGGDADLGISVQHLRMTGHSHTWHYPI